RKELRAVATEALDRAQVRGQVRVTRAHGVDLHMRAAHGAEADGGAHPFVRAGQSRDAHASFDRERLRIATGVAHVAAKSLECRAALVIWLELREPAITHARDPSERLVGRAADPHRNGTLH